MEKFAATCGNLDFNSDDFSFDEDNRCVTLDESVQKVQRIKNVIVQAEDFLPDDTFSDYGFKAEILVENVTENDYANVIFDLAEVQSQNYAPSCITYEGGVAIFAKAAPDSSIEIPLIEITKL